MTSTSIGMRPEGGAAGAVGVPFGAIGVSGDAGGFCSGGVSAGAGLPNSAGRGGGAGIAASAAPGRTRPAKSANKSRPYRRRFTDPPGRVRKRPKPTRINRLANIFRLKTKAMSAETESVALHCLSDYWKLDHPLCHPVPQLQPGRRDPKRFEMVSSRRGGSRQAAWFKLPNRRACP